MVVAVVVDLMRHLLAAVRNVRRHTIGRSLAVPFQQRVDLVSNPRHKRGQLSARLELVPKLGLDDVTETKFTDPVQGDVIHQTD